MSLPPRPVIVVDSSGHSLRVTIAQNGSAYTVADLADLARYAGIEPRRVSRGVLLPADSTPELVREARKRRVVVQQRKSSTTTEAPTFQPQARSGVDDQVEPTHGCAGAVCRMPGCHRARRAS